MNMVIKIFCIVLLGVVVLFGIKNKTSANTSMDIRWDEILTRLYKKFPDIKRMSRQELSNYFLDKEDRRIVILDVRAEDEYGVSHLPSAVNVESVEDVLQKIPDLKKDDVIVTYCSVGYRSSALAQKLQNMGYSDVKDLEGSIFMWANEGRELVGDGTNVKKVHPYNKVWGRLLNKNHHP